MLLVKTDVGFEIRVEAGTPIVKHCDTADEAIEYIKEVGAMHYSFVDESVPKSRYWGTSCK